MARTPVPDETDRGVVSPPNRTGAAGNGAKNSYLPLDRKVGGAIPLTHGSGGDRRGGSADLTGQRSPVTPPDHRFDSSAAKMPQPPSAIEPGRGAIPVSPWAESGKPNRATPQPDTLQPPRK
jgi:hypothetical protein